MANSPEFYDDTVIGAVAAATEPACDSGYIAVYSGAQPALNGSLTGTQLAEAMFGSTAFGSPAASGGTVTATANTITEGTIASTGTAGYFAILEDDNSTVVMTGSVGTSDADLVLSTLSFVEDATFSVSSFTWSQPQD